MESEVKVTAMQVRMVAACLHAVIQTFEEAGATSEQTERAKAMQQWLINNMESDPGLNDSDTRDVYLDLGERFMKGEQPCN